MTAISASRSRRRCPDRYPGRPGSAETVVFGKSTLQVRGLSIIPDNLMHGKEGNNKGNKGNYRVITWEFPITDVWKGNLE
ncbi:hypothetical protein NSB25_00640 [Acetatifactor muris]|uniref:Uncharacterized protein n=1 Tax=Acetatifactor muris TaxID=879566 RepID=A0A2K4ZGD9_9FIRM|nr:hypothetical protein [Acetatifactor muris]MCR2045794.1 hypothetical protein [Acetatifactor muris]SOY29531.1 hypothetical protein AMURIS_02252 [Acetatifactor muris]